MPTISSNQHSRPTKTHVSPPSVPATTFPPFRRLASSTHTASNNDFRPHPPPRAPCAWGGGEGLQWAWRDPAPNCELEQKPGGLRGSDVGLTQLLRVYSPGPECLPGSAGLSRTQSSTHPPRPRTHMLRLPLRSSRGASVPEPIGQTECGSQYPAISLAHLQKEPLPF